MHCLFCILWNNGYCLETAYAVNNRETAIHVLSALQGLVDTNTHSLFWVSRLIFPPEHIPPWVGEAKKLKHSLTFFRCNPFTHMVHLLQQSLRLPLQSHKATAHQFVSCFLWSCTSWHVPYHIHYSRGHGASHHAPYPLAHIAAHWMLWCPPIKLQRWRET